MNGKLFPLICLLIFLNIYIICASSLYILLCYRHSHLKSSLGSSEVLASGRSDDGSSLLDDIRDGIPVGLTDVLTAVDHSL